MILWSKLVNQEVQVFKKSFFRALILALEDFRNNNRKFLLSALYSHIEGNLELWNHLSETCRIFYIVLVCAMTASCEFRLTNYSIFSLNNFDMKNFEYPAKFSSFHYIMDVRIRQMLQEFSHLNRALQFQARRDLWWKLMLDSRKIALALEFLLLNYFLSLPDLFMGENFIIYLKISNSEIWFMINLRSRLK